jgi:hypothetical protein
MHAASSRREMAIGPTDSVEETRERASASLLEYHIDTIGYNDLYQSTIAIKWGWEDSLRAFVCMDLFRKRE